MYPFTELFSSIFINLCAWRVSVPRTVGLWALVKTLIEVSVDFLQGRGEEARHTYQGGV